MVDHESTDIWTQGWITPKSLDLEGDRIPICNVFVAELKRAHIRLRDNLICIVWSQNKLVGNYTTISGYQAMMNYVNHDVYWLW